jgi:hypothetical protein
VLHVLVVLFLPPIFGGMRSKYSDVVCCQLQLSGGYVRICEEGYAHSINICAIAVITNLYV